MKEKSSVRINYHDRCCLRSNSNEFRPGIMRPKKSYSRCSMSSSGAYYKPSNGQLPIELPTPSGRGARLSPCTGLLVIELLVQIELREAERTTKDKNHLESHREREKICSLKFKHQNNIDNNLKIVIVHHHHHSVHLSIYSHFVLLLLFYVPTAS